MQKFRTMTAFLIAALTITGALTLLVVSAESETAKDTPTPASGQWTDAEKKLISSLALNNLKPVSDPSNRYENDATAIAFGTRLFFDQSLSRDGKVSCASCHKPQAFFNDQLVLAMGQDIGRRNTPSLHGIAYNDWFFWDGRKDSLWSQALAPLENQAEHGFSRTTLAKLIMSNPTYFTTYTKIFGEPGNLDPEIFANTGKAIAAYVATLKPLASRFDTYAQAIQDENRNDKLLNPDELRGLRLFIGKKAGCINCHSGPLLTNQSFHNIGSGSKGDAGRAVAINKVRFDPFNCLGAYSDATEDQCEELRYMQRDGHQLWGSFKTPSLRNVSNTPPYFHDGRYKTLAEVIDHYTDSKPDKTHLPAVELTARDKLDLIAFLKTLSASQ